jgi:hypothetical protein
LLSVTLVSGRQNKDKTWDKIQEPILSNTDNLI